jgi:hypothetical protein
VLAVLVVQTVLRAAAAAAAVAPAPVAALLCLAPADKSLSAAVRRCLVVTDT